MKIPAPSGHARLAICFSGLDVGLAAASPLVALFMRHAILLSSADVTLIGTYWAVSFASSLSAFAAFRIYDGIARYLSVHDVLAVAKAVVAGEFITGAVWFAYARLDDIPRSVPFLHALLLGVGLLTVRTFARIGAANGRDAEQALHPQSRNIILIGLNELTVLYIKFLETCAARGQRVIGVLDKERRWIGRSVNGVRVFGPPEQLDSLIKEFAVHGVRTDAVVVGGGQDFLPAPALDEVRRLSKQHNIDLTFVCDFFGIGSSDLVEPARSVAPLDRSPPSVTLPRYFKVKRAIDFGLALTLLVGLLPLFIAVAALAYLDVGSPILFWQERAGRRGHGFLLYKIRTLRPAFDWRGSPVPEELRLSPIGSLLRRLRLDEMPQLLSVLVGDMSLIGPRPLLPEDQPPSPTIRLMVRPGITGWAQVNGGTLLSPGEKGELDEWYILNATLRLDLRIVWMTILYLVRGNRQSEEALAYVRTAKAALPAGTILQLATAQRADQQQPDPAPGGNEVGPSSAVASL